MFCSPTVAAHHPFGERTPQLPHATFSSLLLEPCHLDPALSRSVQLFVQDKRGEGQLPARSCRRCKSDLADGRREDDRLIASERPPLLSCPTFQIACAFARFCPVLLKRYVASGSLWSASVTSSDPAALQMKDPWLLPFILPCVFAIAKGQSKDEFNSVTLPALKPLFALTDPPQNMLSASPT